jgi:MscS family membrane protein
MLLLLLLKINWEALETRIADEKLSNILWFLGIIIATFILKKPLATMVAKVCFEITNKYGGKRYVQKFLALTKLPFEWLIQTLLFYVAFSQLSILLSKYLMHKHEGYNLLQNLQVGDIVNLVFKFLLIFFSTFTASRVLDFIFFVQIEKAHEDNEIGRQQLMPLLKELFKIILWTLGLFWVLGSVFQVNIPALITGLGIGGVAIALAAKESVENFFAAFTILTDHPFQMDDFIRLGTMEGKVERIGFRSTRVRHADGSLFVIPNKKLIGENLENLSNRNNRKVKISITLRYGFSKEHLEELMAQIKNAMLHIQPVAEPVDLLIDSFGEQTFQLSISYHLPHPLPDGFGLEKIKKEINTSIYALIYKFTLKTESNLDLPFIDEEKTNDDSEEKSDSLI